MDKWVKNVIGLCLAGILVVIGWQVFQGAEGEFTAWDFNVKWKPQLDSSPEPVTPENPGAVACRLPEHGVERWEVESRTIDSGWRKGGSSPGEFCGAQQTALVANNSGKDVVLVSTDEKHKSEYTPFKHDYYRYACLFEIREPVYHMAPNAACPSS